MPESLDRLPKSWSNVAMTIHSIVTRFLGLARRLWSKVAPLPDEMLDHVIVLDDKHLGRLMGEYRNYFNEARPHQGIGQRVPGKPALVADVTKPIVAKPVLGGLHYDYRRAA